MAVEDWGTRAAEAYSMQAYHLQSATYRKILCDYSGHQVIDIKSLGSGLKVDVGTIDVEVDAEISGKPVDIKSMGSGLRVDVGTVDVEAVAEVSGQSIDIKTLGSGLYVEVGDVTADVSGQSIDIKTLGSGLFVEAKGDVTANVSGQSVDIKTMGSGMGVTVSGNIVTISGDVSISGNMVTTSFSGNIVTSDVSGQSVDIKTMGSGLKVDADCSVTSLSGQSLHTAGVATIRVDTLKKITSASGGEAIGTSGAVHSVVVKNLSGNADMFIGGTNQPYSGRGFLLAGEEAITIDTREIGEVYACANKSGNIITHLGTDY